MPAIDTPPADVSARGLCRSYGDGPSRIDALRDVTFTLPAGERAALLGKSGSGKSTLLNLIGGLDRPTAGELSVGERPLAKMRSNALARFRLATLGFVFQSFNLATSRTALENVELPLMLAGWPVARRREKASAALKEVGLGERLGHRPSQLSGGEQQRVAIARALVNDPALVLADEPTGNLDSRTAHQVVELLLGRIETRRATLVLVTHDEALAHRCATIVYHMEDGRLRE